jgi:hypothetical protein
MLPEQVLEKIQQDVEKTPFLDYRPIVTGAVIHETKTFKDYNDKDTKGEYAIVEFVPYKSKPTMVGEFEKGSTSDDLGFVRFISSIDSKRMGKMIEKLRSLIAANAFDKTNIKPDGDGKGNETFDAKVKYLYGLKFVKVLTEAYVATRWDAIKKQNVPMTRKKDGSQIIMTDITIMLEEGGETFREVYTREYKRRVEPNLVGVTAAPGSDQIPSNTSFEAEKV